MRSSESDMVIFVLGLNCDQLSGLTLSRALVISVISESSILSPSL